MRTLYCVLVVGLLLAAPGGVAAQHDAPTGTVQAIESLLSDMVDAWNADDLAGHAAAYADGATYVTPQRILEGPSEIEQALAGFQRPDGLAGTLRFTEVTIRGLGDDHALVLGRFTLDDFDGGSSTGRFTLVAGRVDGRWVLLHDHSS